MATADRNRSCRGGAPVYQTRHGINGEVSLGETVIDAIATAEGVDPTDYDLELYDVVDLEALDVLFERRSDDHWRFEFSVSEYLVVVEGDGEVAVYEC